MEYANSLLIVDSIQEAHTLAVHPVTGDVYATKSGNLWKYEFQNSYQKILVGSTCNCSLLICKASVGDTGVCIDTKGVIYATDYTQKAFYQIQEDGSLETYHLAEQPWSGSIGTIYVNSNSESSKKLSDSEVIIIVFTVILSVAAIATISITTVFIIKMKARQSKPLELPTIAPLPAKEESSHRQPLERKRTLSNVRRNQRFSINIQGIYLEFKVNLCRGS